MSNKTHQKNNKNEETVQYVHRKIPDIWNIQRRVAVNCNRITTFREKFVVICTGGNVLKLHRCQNLRTCNAPLQF